MPLIDKFFIASNDRYVASPENPLDRADNRSDQRLTGSHGNFGSVPLKSRPIDSSTIASDPLDRMRRRNILPFRLLTTGFDAIRDGVFRKISSAGFIVRKFGFDHGKRVYLLVLGEKVLIRRLAAKLRRELLFHYSPEIAGGVYRLD